MSTHESVTPRPPASPGPAGPNDPSSAYAPLPASDADSDPSPRSSILDPPNPQFSQTFFGGPGFGPGSQTPRDSVATSNPQSLHGDSGSRNDSNTALALGAAAAAGAGAGAGAGMGADLGSGVDAAESGYGHNEYNEKGFTSASGSASRRKKFLLLGGLVAFIIAAAIAIPVGVVVSNNNKSSKSATSSGSNGDPAATNNPGGTNSPSNKNPTTGGDGSTVTTDDGSTFTYENKFGGFWVYNPEDPFNNNAQPNSWTPPLNTTWTWGSNKVYGVNLGGWFVLEPFISPSLYQKYQNSSPQAIDEWTLSQAMAADTSSGGGLQNQLEDHYNTFITEQDFAQIAGAGLNWIRVPIPFWAIDVWDDEPFLARVSWTYILRMFRWARKYGLRVNLDLHTIPGSQNGYNHSGKDGQVNFLMGVMGYANAQRTLGYIRIFTEFIAQEQYQAVVPMFGIVNEALTQQIGQDIISHFYLQAYDIMRSITGFGEGKGPYISIHDGFQGTGTWAGYFPGADRLVLDTHPYFAFNGQSNLDPIGAWPAKACNGFGPGMNTSQTAFGVTVAGEWSNGINDCGLYLNGVGGGHSYGGDCDFWMDSTQWNETIVDGLKTYALASMDALQNWFFWTWKIGNSSTTNTVQSPLWSYSLGLSGGWMPTDPRSAVGTCASLGVVGDQFDESYAASQTGAVASPTIDAAFISSYSAWPPASMSGLPAGGDIAFQPTYTATGAVSTLPVESSALTDAPKTLSVGDGWADVGDTSEGVTEVKGCTYPDAWDSAGVTMPTTLCPAGSAAATATATTSAVTSVATTTAATETTAIDTATDTATETTETTRTTVATATATAKREVGLEARATPPPSL